MLTQLNHRKCYTSSQVYRVGTCVVR